MTAKTTTGHTAISELGIVLRPYHGQDDLPAIAAVINASMAADGIDIVRNVNEVRNFLEHSPNFDPSQDTFLAEADGNLIAYGDATWNDENAGGRVYRADTYVLPDYRATSLPAVLFGSLIERLEAVAASHADIQPKVLHVSLGEKEDALRAVVERQGFKPTRTFYRMVRGDLKNIPDIPLPSGLEVRQVRPEDKRAIYEALKEAFRDHWGTRPASEDDYQQWEKDPIANPDLWQVAWDEDEIAGMVLNFVDEDENQRYDRARGYTEGICVRRPWRRRGLARALIARSLQVLADAGMTEAALGVDSDNQTGALDLYLGLGYETRWKFFAFRKPLTPTA
jgi:ribosomal protein S18 acetylase RimI-like enzyme